MNVAIDTPSASMRTSPSRSEPSPLPPARSTRIAPASGKKTISERIIRSSADTSQQSDDAQKQRWGVGSNRPGLRATQESAGRAHGITHAVDGAVDHAGVGPFPEATG